MNRKAMRKAEKTPEYILGFTAGHDAGYQRASNFYMRKIRELTGVLDLTDPSEVRSPSIRESETL